MKKRMVCFFVLFFAFFVSIVKAEDSENSTKSNVAAFVKAQEDRALEIERKIEEYVKNSPTDYTVLIKKMGPVALKFQSEKYTEKNKYLAELSPFSDFMEKVVEFSSGKKEVVDLTRLISQLFITSSDKKVAAGNGFTILDIIYNSDYDGYVDQVNKNLWVRRYLGEYGMRLGFIKYIQADYPVDKELFEPPQKVKIMKGLAENMIPKYSAVIKKATEIIGVFGLTECIFLEKIMEYVKDDKFVELINSLHNFLLTSYSEIKKDNEKVKLYNLFNFSERVAKNPEFTMALLGAFSTQHKTIARSVMSRLADKNEQIRLFEPLTKCALNFFIIQEINALTVKEGRYTFSYPRPIDMENKRFYHFWSEAYTAFLLAKNGFSEEEVGFITKNTGRAYETYTLPINLMGTLKAKLPNAARKCFDAVCGFGDDVKSHELGGIFGFKYYRDTETLPPLK